jgi:peptide/nickel transport system substrate-binding protein
VKKSLVHLLHREWYIPHLSRAESAFKKMSITEKAFFCAASFVFCISGILLLHKVNDSFLIEVPAQGGVLREGIVGTPRFINPLLALSDADKDLTTLTYAGLMKATPEGTLLPELAESYSISEDGLTYSFILKANARFSDGTQVTTDDVEFTVQKAQDSILKSPRRAAWEGVTITKKSATEISFKLKQPYAPFIENTTLGILPKHIWKAVEAEQFAFSQFNVDPIGAGPYTVDAITRNKTGIPVEYSLKANASYVLGRPYISTITIHFFQSEQTLIEALKNKTIDSASGLSADTVYTQNLPHITTKQAPFTRVFSIFFDQNNSPALLDPSVRKALDKAINKDTVLTQVLHTFGTKRDGPLPKIEKDATITGTSTQEEDTKTYQEEARFS